MLGFSLFPGIGPMYFQRLVNFFGTSKKAYNAPEKELQKILPTRLLSSFVAFRLRTDLDREKQILVQKGIGYVSIEDGVYPLSLKNISDPPIGLFYKGQWNKIDWNNGLFCAVVGTRKPTFYGRSTTSKLVKVLVQKGVTIVSGLALGIDACAHVEVLSNKGNTVAVLGCGVDIKYPRENTHIYDLIEKQGVIISEFPPSHTVLKGLFVARNRIISGLSKTVIVIEGSSHSGSLITARYAAEQGRGVCAVPGEIGNEQAEGPLILIKEGARLVTKIEDILDELNVSSMIQAVKERVPEDVLQKEIVDLLKKNPQSTDGICTITKKNVTRVGKELSFLELEGYIIQDEVGRWHVKN